MVVTDINENDPDGRIFERTRMGKEKGYLGVVKERKIVFLGKERSGSKNPTTMKE